MFRERRWKAEGILAYVVLQKRYQVAIGCFSAEVPSYLIKKEILCSESDTGVSEGSWGVKGVACFNERSILIVLLLALLK